MSEAIQIKVRPIQKDAPGFLPRWRNLLSAKRALGEFEKAQPEDVDGAMSLLMEHILEPADPFEARRALEQVSADELMKLFDAIMGRNTVPPASGGA